MSTPSKSHLKHLERIRREKAKQKSNETTTPFRREEQYWKSRLVEPDLSKAFRPDKIDLQESSETISENCSRILWQDHIVFCVTVNIESKDTDDLRQIKIYSFQDYPGFYFIPSYLSEKDQRSLAQEAIIDAPRHPNTTNHDAHYHVPQIGLWEQYKIEDTAPLIKPKASDKPAAAETRTFTRREQVNNSPASYDDIKKQPSSHDDPEPSPNAKPAKASELITKLRWATVGLQYHWGTKAYKFDETVPQIPQLMHSSTQEIVRRLPWAQIFANDPAVKDLEMLTDWSSYTPEAGVVNYYTEKDSLTAHIDHSEPNPTAPLASISLGLDAVFLVGGKTRDIQPFPIHLKSGDVCLMTGPSRRVYHGIPRVFDGSLASAFEPSNIDDSSERSHWESLGHLNFLKQWRLNINLRQVF